VVAESAAWLVETPDRFLDLPRPEPDVRLLDDPAIRSLYLSTVREAVKQGIDAYAWDGVLERRPWGFALVEIASDIWIFQGRAGCCRPTIGSRETVRRAAGEPRQALPGHRPWVDPRSLGGHPQRADLNP